MESIRLPLPVELLNAIDAARGDVPRTVWVRRAIEQRLEGRIRDEDHPLPTPNVVILKPNDSSDR